MSNIIFERDGPVCVITIDRPKRRNAVDGLTAIELREAFESFDNDDALRVAVLTGSGSSFCAGADLSALDDPSRCASLDPEGCFKAPMGPTRMLLSKPMIAAIEGHAVAGGLELALLADLRVASEDAVLGVFCRRFGVPLIDGGSVRLPRLIGMGRALDLILTGRPVDAFEALSMGLVNRVVGSGEALESARRLAADIASFPQESMLADRRSAYEQWGLPLSDALQAEGRAAAPIAASEIRVGLKRIANRQGRTGRFEG